MAYEMKPPSCNPAKLKGLSEKLIVSHYEHIYGGGRSNASMRSPTGGKRWMAQTRRYL